MPMPMLMSPLVAVMGLSCVLKSRRRPQILLAWQLKDQVTESSPESDACKAANIGVTRRHPSN